MQDKIKSFFAQNKIYIEIVGSVSSYQVTTYLIKLTDFNLSTFNKILKLQKLLSIYLQVKNINITMEEEKGLIKIETPIEEKKTFKYNDLVKDYKKQENGLYCNFGIDTNNKIQKYNICNFPHLLVAGTTGSGKSVFVNSLIMQLLENYTPQELELILIDIKQVEFSIYKNIPHLLYDPIKTLEESRKILQKSIEDMTARYEILEKNNCKNIEEYNNKFNDKMKYKLIIIDELAELLLLEQNKLKSNLEGYDTIEKYICRIAQLGRASGLHLIVSTQRPSTDVISGLIKSNIPSRIALTVQSATNSKIILDETGAEKLTGKGDLLLKIVGTNNTIRLQSAYISSNELIERIETIKNKYNYNNKIEEIEQRNILKDLEKYIDTAYNKSELKSKCYIQLQKNNIINGIIEEIGQTEEEKTLLKNNYFKILNDVTKFYNGYILEEREQIKADQKEQKEKEKIQKMKKADNVATLYLIHNFLKGFNKKLK